MTSTQPSTQPHAYDTPTPVEQLEETASEAELGVGVALRAVEIGAAVFLGLLVCPPLLILVVVVVVPLAAMAILLTLVAAILAVPYLLVRHLRGHHGGGHAALFAHRLRGVGHAIHDLWPHRIHAHVRQHGAHR